MTVGPNLSIIDSTNSFYALKEINRLKLFEALDRKERSKALVFDTELTKPFFLICNVKDLQEHGVNSSHIFSLQNGPAPNVAVEHVIYICQPSLSKMEMVVENVRNIRKDDQRQFHLMFIPRTSIFCEDKLKEADVLNKFSTITALPIYAYCWDSDVLSMQNERFFSDCIMNGNLLGLYEISMLLLQLEEVFGQFSQCYYKGTLAEQIYKFLKKKRGESSTTSAGEAISRVSSPIDKLVIIDRSVDLITPLITQLTYEGLIDELFGIKCTQCKFPIEKFAPSSATSSGQDKPSTSTPTKKDLVLNSKEELFDELRDLNFSAVGQALSKSIKSTAELEQRNPEMTVREYKEFVKRIPKIQAAKSSASTHLSIAELLKETTTTELFLDTVSTEQEILNSIDVDRVLPFIEELINKGEEMFTVLRLICLQSLVSDGLKPKIFEQYKKEFLQAYGYNQLTLLVNLQKAGLLKVYNAKTGKGPDVTPFSTIRKTFRLVVEDVNEQKPNDLAYAYSGYAPLTGRLCQYLQKPGWTTILENLKRLPGSVGVDENFRYTKPNVKTASSDKNLTLVVFVGGVTFAEISILRFLSESSEGQRFLILTTNIVNGKTIISDLSL